MRDDEQRSRGIQLGLTRRELVARGTAAGVGLTVVGGARGASPAPEQRLPAGAWELEEATLGELASAMGAGRSSSHRLCKLYLERIEAVDRSGPGLRSIIETNPEALAIAEERDRERRDGRVRGVLHGVPVVVKDNLATADRMETTAGSLALVGARPTRDASVVERLRAAGAVILAKTNLSEWANIRSTHSSSGWSARGGQCRNPYALDRSPCGSSSGTAAAVAGNLAAVGIGTETDGSVVCPSAACALVGIKPTLGRVSRAGIVPIAHSQDTAGPMARTVRDAATLLAAIEGHDVHDRSTAEAERHRLELDDLFEPAGLRGTRIGVPRERFFGYSPEADAVAEEALEVIRAEGAVLVDPADIPHAGDYDEAEMEVLLYELKADLERYLAEFAPGSPVRTLADIVAFNRAHREREMPYFGQELFERAAAKGGLGEQAYREALATCRRLARSEGLDRVFVEHRLDALIAPTGGPPWPIDLVNGDHYLGGSSSPAAVSGYPSITVPAGAVFGLPVGISLVGRAWSEPLLIRLAYAFERATATRRPPRFLATADLRVD